MTLEEFLKEDRFALAAGVELTDVKPGYAKAQMEIKPMHLNAANVVQGGAIFTLADLAFAAAANAYGTLAVSVETSIRFFQGVGTGTLYAEAKTVHIHRKLATLEVTITNENHDRIALFTGTAYRKNVVHNFVDPLSTNSLA